MSDTRTLGFRAWLCALAFAPAFVSLPAWTKTEADCKQEFSAKAAAGATGGQSQAQYAANNEWSLGGTHGPFGNSYNNFLTQPFFNYNFGEGWYVGTSPIITANWQASGGKWVVPVGAEIGRVVKLGGKLPVNFLLGAYYNVVTPKYGADWQLRSQVTLIF